MSVLDVVSIGSNRIVMKLVRNYSYFQVIMSSMFLFYWENHNYTMHTYHLFLSSHTYTASVPILTYIHIICSYPHIHTHHLFLSSHTYTTSVPILTYIHSICSYPHIHTQHLFLSSHTYTASVSILTYIHSIIFVQYRQLQLTYEHDPQ